MRRAAFHGMIQALNSPINVLDDTIVTDRPQVEALLGNMNTLSGLLKQHDDMLASILQSAPIALRGSGQRHRHRQRAGDQLPERAPGRLLDVRHQRPRQQFGMIEYHKDCEARQGVRDPGDRRRPGDRGGRASNGWKLGAGPQEQHHASSPSSTTARLYPTNNVQVLGMRSAASPR